MIRSLAFGILCAASAAGATAYLLADPATADRVDQAMHTSADAVTQLAEQVRPAATVEAPAASSTPTEPAAHTAVKPAPAAPIPKPAARTRPEPDYEAMARQLQSLSERLEAFTERIHEHPSAVNPTR